MRIRDEYLHGSDLTGVVKKIEVTIGTGNNANKSVIKYIKADSEGGVVEVPIGDITGKAATASKLDNTSAIGSKTNPVYFTANGVPSACTYSLNATVPVGAANKVLYYSASNTLDTQSYSTLTSNLDVFTAATSSAAGKKGLVPAPAANQLGNGNFFLRADGVWTVIENKTAALNGTATSLVTTGEKYNWNSAYNWYNSMTSGDTDGVINKWKEVEAFLANYGDSSTLAEELAKLVTLSTNQTITGVKTFSEVINGSITGNAGTASSVDWSGVTNKPSSFTPSSHTHTKSEITDFPSSLPANGGNADTVGGYSSLDFLLKTEHETFESIIATALTDLDNRKIEASDIPTSLPANGGNADFAENAGNSDTVDGKHANDFVQRIKGTGSVVHYISSLRNWNGVLITLPLTWSPVLSGMFAFTIRIYNSYIYTDIVISGYCYESYHWHEPKAEIIGGTNANYKVKFGWFDTDDNKKLWVWIGKSNNAVFSWGGLSIMNVHCGNSAYNMYEGWESANVSESELTNVQYSIDTLYSPVKSNGNITGSSGSCTGNAATATNVDWSGVTNRPTNVSQFTNDAGYITSHAYSYGSIDIYDTNGTKKTSNNTVSASVNTETLRLQEGANITITATNSGDPGSDVIKIAVTGIESNIDRNGYGKLALWNNGASLISSFLSAKAYNDILTVKAGSGINFTAEDTTVSSGIWTISAIPYNCAITLSNNSPKSLVKDSWSADKDSVYLTSNGAPSGTFLAAGTYALWIEDRSSDSGTPNYYSGTFTCAGNATAGRLDEIALHSSMATAADTNAPTRIFVATQISGTSGKHVLRFCSLDGSATNHYLTVKVNRII